MSTYFINTKSRVHLWWPGAYRSVRKGNQVRKLPLSFCGTCLDPALATQDEIVTEENVLTKDNLCHNCRRVLDIRERWGIREKLSLGCNYADFSKEA